MSLMRIAASLAATALLALATPFPGQGRGTDDPEPGGSTHPRGGVAQLSYKQESDAHFGSLLVRAAGGLVLITGLTFGLAVIAKRYLPGVGGYSADRKTRIKLLESRRITPRLTLLLIDYEGEHLLLAQSGDRVVQLGASRAAAPATSEAAHGV